MTGTVARGWVQIASGVVLVGLMAVVGWNILPTLLAPGEEIDGSTFTGTEGQAQLVLLVLGLTALVGVAALASGIIQVVTGRQNRLVTAIALGLASLLMALAYGIQRFGL